MVESQESVSRWKYIRYFMAKTKHMKGHRGVTVAPKVVRRGRKGHLAVVVVAVVVQLFSSIQFSRSVMSNSLRSQGLQQARLPCPSFTQTHVH